MTPDPSTEARTTERITENARWAIDKLGADGMDGISAVNFAYDVLALAARLSQAEEALVAMQETAADLAMQRAEMRRALGKAEEALREIHEYQCGCDQPGRSDLCVAQPVAYFAALAASSAGETDA